MGLILMERHTLGVFVCDFGKSETKMEVLNKVVAERSEKL